MSLCVCTKSWNADSKFPTTLVIAHSFVGLGWHEEKRRSYKSQTGLNGKAKETEEEREEKQREKEGESGGVSAEEE